MNSEAVEKYKKQHDRLRCFIFKSFYLRISFFLALVNNNNGLFSFLGVSVSFRKDKDFCEI